MLRHPIRYLILTHILLGILIRFMIFGDVAEGAEPILISAPEQAYQCGVKSLLNGLTEIAYDTDQNGIADKFTLTRQGITHPLFYAQDANEDGRWEMVVKDIEEDGVNGNEREYLKVLQAGK